MAPQLKNTRWLDSFKKLDILILFKTPPLNRLTKIPQQKGSSSHHSLSVADRSPQVLEALTTLWEASARATHTFLTEEDIISLCPVIAEALMEIPHLIFYVKNIDAFIEKCFYDIVLIK